MARELAETDTETAIALASGEVGPPDKMDDLMLRKIVARAVADGAVVVDGYPRYIEQIADLLLWAAGTGRRQGIGMVVLDCAPGATLRRCTGERARPDDTRGPLSMRMRTWEEEGQRAVRWFEKRNPGAVARVNTSLVGEDRPLASIRDEVHAIIQLWSEA